MMNMRMCVSCFVSMLLVTAAMGAITEDWAFEDGDGTVLSNTSNSAGSASWTTELDGFVGVDQGALVRGDGYPGGTNLAYADIADITSGVATIVVEDIDIDKWNATSDEITIVIDNNTTTAVDMTLRNPTTYSNTLELSGGSYYGTDLGAAKTFVDSNGTDSASISDLSIALEFDIENKQYRVMWKEGMGAWQMSDYAASYSGGHEARRLRLEIAGYNLEGEGASIGRIYVMDGQIPEPATGGLCLVAASLLLPKRNRK